MDGKYAMYPAQLINDIAEALRQVKELPDKINRETGVLYPEKVVFNDEEDVPKVELVYDWGEEEWIVHISDSLAYI